MLKRVVYVAAFLSEFTSVKMCLTFRARESPNLELIQSSRIRLCPFTRILQLLIVKCVAFFYTLKTFQQLAPHRNLRRRRISLSEKDALPESPSPNPSVIRHGV